VPPSIGPNQYSPTDPKNPTNPSNPYTLNQPNDFNMLLDRY
jgi:hypothetical protein